MLKDECILTINGGSSSIKFSLYKIKQPLEILFCGEIENIGSAKAKLSFNNSVTEQKNSNKIQATDHDRSC